jgi:DNA polymerase III gamma/tau subunit
MSNNYYISYSIKYRPESFDDVIGKDYITTYLKKISKYEDLISRQSNGSLRDARSIFHKTELNYKKSEKLSIYYKNCLNTIIIY